jgi:hypothetical protein
LLKTSEDCSGRNSSIRSFILFALVANAISLTSDLPARSQDVQWQPYTSADYQFTVLEPGPVTLGTIGVGAATTFSVKSKDCEYYILARKLSTEERVSSWFGTDEVLWQAFLKAYGSKPTTVKDASGKGWIGKAFTQISADKPKKSGIFAISTNGDINYYAIVAGPELTDVSKFLDSFQVTEKPDNTMTMVISLVLFSLFALSLAVAINLIARSKAKQK